MNTILWLICILAALVILGEALNKIIRASPRAARRSGAGARAELLAWLKGVSWIMFALGAGGVFARLLFNQSLPDPDALLVLVGLAVIVIRSRVKEG